MQERPKLSKALSAEEFSGYYFLKSELQAFCRAEGLSASGGKAELTARVKTHLAGGVQEPPRIKAERRPAFRGEITEDSVIEHPFVCSEKHRAFFREQLGKSFTFLVPFQKWLKENAGKTYGDAVRAYAEIVAEKKRSSTVISPQFEYNTYIRDFFADNPGALLKEAIACWNYKKAQPGSHRYAAEDLAALAGERMRRKGKSEG